MPRLTTSAIETVCRAILRSLPDPDAGGLEIHVERDEAHDAVRLSLIDAGWGLRAVSRIDRQAFVTDRRFSVLYGTVSRAIRELEGYRAHLRT